jgi:cyclopropane fatty-acyl-phospholipid synthase-like methyltransferase
LGSVEDETWTWLHVHGRNACRFLDDYLPGVPSENVQRQTTAQVGSPSLETGGTTYRVFKQLHERHARPLDASDQILDFGCGWGRITRFFLKDVKPENLVGIDIDEVAIEACRQTNHWSRFERTPVLPPTQFDERTFDLIYAYSVFSHLSEQAHLQWLKEFFRITKPGGVVIVTTLPRSYIERGKEFRTARQAQLQAFDRGEYCYQPLNEELNPHFGLACIPESYVRRVWAKLLNVREVMFDEEQLPQVVIACSRTD